MMNEEELMEVVDQVAARASETLAQWDRDIFIEGVAFNTLISFRSTLWPAIGLIPSAEGRAQIEEWNTLHAPRLSAQVAEVVRVLLRRELLGTGGEGTRS